MQRYESQFVRFFVFYLQYFYNYYILFCCVLPAWNKVLDGDDDDEQYYTARFTKQEAQLSQRDRAPLRVIEYFPKSLKVTQDHSKWHCCVGRM